MAHAHVWATPGAAIPPPCQITLNKWVKPVLRVARHFNLCDFHDSDHESHYRHHHSSPGASPQEGNHAQPHQHRDSGVKAPSFPGDNPVFIFEGKYVIKFFADDSELTRGNQSYFTEVFLYSKVFPKEGDDEELLVPRFIGQSTLKDVYASVSEEEAAKDLETGEFDIEDGWRWPFIITTRINGRPIKHLRGQLTHSNRLAFACDLGIVVRKLFATPIPQPPPDETPNLRTDYFADFLERRLSRCVEDQKKWKTLSPHLLEQIPAYLPSSAKELLEEPWEAELGLIHGDVHSEHARLTLYTEDGDEGGEQKMRLDGLIDFGDAVVGNKMYEMTQVHLNNFHCDKEMLKVFMKEYLGWASFEDKRMKDKFIYHAMCYTLLHEFDALDSSLYMFEFDKIDTLETLAKMIWDLSDMELVSPILPRRRLASDS